MENKKLIFVVVFSSLFFHNQDLFSIKRISQLKQCYVCCYLPKTERIRLVRTINEIIEENFDINPSRGTTTVGDVETMKLATLNAIVAGIPIPLIEKNLEVLNKKIVAFFHEQLAKDPSVIRTKILLNFIFGTIRDFCRIHKFIIIDYFEHLEPPEYVVDRDNRIPGENPFSPLMEIDEKGFDCGEED